MSDGFEEARILVEWYKRYFLIAGVWPLAPSNLRFIGWTTYVCIQYSLVLTMILNVNTGMEIVITATDLSWLSMILPKLIVMRLSRKLPELLNNILHQMSEVDFETAEEKEVYLSYSRRAKSFAVIMAPLTICGVLSHYTTPLIELVRAAHGYNGTGVPVIVPFETYVFIDIQDYYTLAAWWIYELLVLVVNTFHPAALGFVLFLVYHSCGELAALSISVRNLGATLGANPNNSAKVFRRIAAKHHAILGVTRDINDVFTLTFLEELFMTTVMIILSLHTVIVTADFSDTGNLVAFTNYAVIMFILIYAYCIAGEYLMIESANVHEAYYECEWYDLPNTCQKQLIICMIGSSKPVQLLGGGFYIFSLSGFTGVLKTAMSYVSLLRTLVA